MKPGDTLDESFVDVLRESQARHDCYRKALSLAAHAEQSASMLATKLAARGFVKSTVDETIGRLVDSGYIDDSRFAEAFIAYRLGSRPEGPVSLLSELRLRGVPGEIAKRAIASAFPEEKRHEALLASAARFAKRGLRDVALYRRLRKIGFRHGEIVEAGILTLRDE